MTNRIRVGAVSYLNTRPLVAHLEELLPNIDLILEVPSLLARDLEERRLDVALIPSIEYYRTGGTYSILPGSCIASHGPVMSVKLCSNVPIGEIKTVALDVGSRTSVALTSIILRHLFGVNPKAEALPLHQDPRQSKADAKLVIGDRAMRVPDGAFPFTLDLGYEWSRWTGLPFVWAFWAVAPRVDLSQEVVDAFETAKAMGRKEIGSLAEREAARLGLDPIQCRYYLERVIRHDFGPEEVAGLSRFYALAQEQGLAPGGIDCVFHDSRNLAEIG